MLRRACVILALVSVAGLGACGKKLRVDLSPGPKEFKPRQYEGVLDRWTRAKLLIRQFDTIINVSATYQSAEFVSAYMALYAKHYRLPRNVHQRLLTRRLGEVTRYHEFYLAATTSDRDWNDFAKKNSVWKITLWDDKGTRVEPIKIKKLRVTEVHRSYFPYTGVFHRAYRVVFPKTVGGKPFVTPGTDWFKLQIASPMGVAELAWFVRRKGNKTDGKAVFLRRSGRLSMLR